MAFAFDDSYLYPFLIALYSAVLHSDVKFEIILADTGTNLSENSKHLIENFCKKIEVEFTWYRIPLNETFNRSSGHVAPLAIGRLFLLDVLPTPFIYSDVDILFLTGWQEILTYSQQTRDVTLRAAEDSMPQETKESWNVGGTNKAFKKDQIYFNSGVFAAEPSLWREKGYPAIWKKLYLEEYESLGFHFLDQDILNYLLSDDFTILDEKFNFQVLWGKSKQMNKNLHPDLGSVSSPRILHFVGSAKPWNYSLKTRESVFSKQSLHFNLEKESIQKTNIFWIVQYWWIERLFWNWVSTQESSFLNDMTDVYSGVALKDF